MEDFTATLDSKPASAEDPRPIAEKHMTPSMEVVAAY
jgi:hypothetical protein